MCREIDLASGIFVRMATGLRNLSRREPKFRQPAKDFAAQFVQKTVPEILVHIARCRF
jgi:hypothetical protein